MKFTTKDLSAIATCSAFWAILNIILSPIFWQLTRLPFFCDLLAFISLILVIWWTQKFGSASLVGFIVTVLTLVLRPGALHMLGFLVASVVFDVLARVVGYANFLEKKMIGLITMIVFSIACAGIAGMIIAYFFMGFKTFSSIIIFSGLHGIGGFIGGTIG
ncbi:MAG: hypothetical protein QXG01_01620, partial [Candidatus Bathyarchaeia archaeon]